LKRETAPRQLGRRSFENSGGGNSVAGGDHDFDAFLQEENDIRVGGLYNINTFDQPGVEEGKKTTAALMGRGRPEDLREAAEVRGFLKKKRRKTL
jgi:glucose-6-phosphate isomerase